MLLLGLLLLAVAVVVGVELVLANRAPMTIHLWNWDWNVHAYGLAAWGGAIVLVGMLGLLMMSSAAGRKRRLRRERRELAAENRDLSVRAERAERVARGEAPAGRGRRFGRRRQLEREQEREAAAAGASGGFSADSMRHQRAVGPDWTAGQSASSEQATTVYPPQEQQAHPPQEQQAYPPQQQTYPGHPQLDENQPGGYSTGTTPENPEGYRG
jgi:hypothetical protein